MNKLTKRNSYGEAILTDASRSDSLANAIEKLCKFEELGDVKDYINEYEWLIELNDDNLATEVIQNNNVQNALIELLNLVNEIARLQNS